MKNRQDLADILPDLARGFHWEVETEGEILYYARIMFDRTGKEIAHALEFNHPGDVEEDTVKQAAKEATGYWRYRGFQLTPKDIAWLDKRDAKKAKAEKKVKTRKTVTDGHRIIVMTARKTLLLLLLIHAVLMTVFLLIPETTVSFLPWALTVEALAYIGVTIYQHVRLTR